MTTPVHELGLYFTSRDLTAHGQPLPDRVVAEASTVQITTESIAQETGYWDGATGFFTDEAPDVLKGYFFHVRSWTAGTDDAPGTLQLYGSLPATPPTGSVFRLCKGGKHASSQEIPGLTVSGKQPEFNPVSHASLPGITVTKASSGLGEGTLTLRSNAKAVSVQISSTTGYGPSVQLTEGVNDLVLYTGGSEGWVRLNVDFQATTNSNVTGTFTLRIPKGVLVPDVEADDAVAPSGRLRYFCVAARNNSEADTVSALGAWTPPLGPETATIQTVAADVITLATEPTSWPLKGFWVRKVSQNSFRYVANRSGNKLYLKALSRASYNFFNGTAQLILGDPLVWNNTTGNSLGTLLDLRITSGSLASGNAAGTLMTSTYYSLSSGIAYNGRTKTMACSMNAGAMSYCDRNFTPPGTWVANDVLEAVSDLDLVAIPGGSTFYDPAAVTEKPQIDMMFRPGHNIDERAISGSLAPGEYAAFWMQQHILPNVPAKAAITGALDFSWY